MANVTISLPDDVKTELDKFPWINWSKLAEEELRKKVIFEKFIRTGTISEDDKKFCEKIDWIPGDWLPLREDFVKRLHKIERGKHSKAMSLSELKTMLNKL